ncbi:hypothetical protein SPFM7_00041 [Salmonella phage SPFM7]|nr:hypothetical protein SPFM7_00041 [Salmonella phage SPFM7]
MTYVEGWERVVQVLIDVLTHVGRTIEYHYWAPGEESVIFEYTHVIGKPSFYNNDTIMVPLTGEKNFEDNFVWARFSGDTPIFSNKHWLLCIIAKVVDTLRPQIGVAIENYRQEREQAQAICLVYEPMDPAAETNLSGILMLGRRPRPAEPEDMEDAKRQLPTSEIEIIEIGSDEFYTVEFDDYEYGLLGAVTA